MSDFTLHTKDTAPEAAKPLIDNSVSAFGMLPNLHAVMAEAPTLLEGYQVLHKLAQETSFSADELTVVWQSINVEHACHYCVPAHTGIAKSMNVSDTLIEELRNDEVLSDSKLNTLKETVLAVTRGRGNVEETQLKAFYDAGYAHKQLLEIILVLAQKVMSNYTNHLAETPVDEPFKKFEWSPK
ncbi:carboxymuconolactone decarboxylase [Alteromonas mediterranea]|jgi:alkylhydroperoxidase family enzyme|uniref:Carboxymuconolactone decarboxylase n=1 Tax=Alteromonas mediterranea TaxID=314275 RepID=A0AAC9JBE9_9ALTE|nr:carboxymuconolactone decarboxylase family protein [Alteromonas mediterranea]MBR9895726.1 carboxymuconolactone decarboxylase family protein [Gammaproteobacteria bacterium]AFV85037.1 putative alkylhydroperoxidase [Alteromonas mediterranea DE1]AGP81408.1 alkylhydroperoxidase [Alteromonas mediterranea MED64]AGP97048.1 alkylhydroperoxidase [Alteromonas mediterranea UM7]AGQ01396.1 alkylhydroperoxidase [Alteromonas mediterranea UM4b]|tara:strand:+ start:1912 stop:2463 length:552 start_codon:yes stop_codon:yes gene_type:complete